MPCGLVATSISCKVLAAPPGVDGFCKFCAASCLFLALLGLEHSSLFKVVTSSPQHCHDSPSALPFLGPGLYCMEKSKFCKYKAHLFSLLLWFVHPSQSLVVCHQYKLSSCEIDFEVFESCYYPQTFQFRGGIVHFSSMELA